MTAETLFLKKQTPQKILFFVTSWFLSRFRKWSQPIRACVLLIYFLKYNKKYSTHSTLKIVKDTLRFKINRGDFFFVTFADPPPPVTYFDTPFINFSNFKDNKEVQKIYIQYHRPLMFCYWKQLHNILEILMLSKIKVLKDNLSFVSSLLYYVPTLPPFILIPCLIICQNLWGPPPFIMDLRVCQMLDFHSQINTIAGLSTTGVQSAPLQVHVHGVRSITCQNIFLECNIWKWMMHAIH